jgi:phosphoserine phosphatase
MPNVAELPYNYRLIRYIQAQKKEGVLIVLATACNEKIAHKIAEHLGLFDEIIASDWSHNRRAHHKAAILIKKFGDSGFVYAGNSKDDLWVWAKAKKAIAVNASRHVLKQLYRMDKEVIVFDGSVGAPCAANEL